MKVLNLGSMNLDLVYTVEHIVQPGETEAADSMECFLGGKGMNQSVALAKAGAEVYHAGLIGTDGQPFLDACRELGVHSEYIRSVDAKSGHAIIQIEKNAQNCILLYGGTNQMLTEEYIDSILSDFGEDDILLLQNEVNLISYAIDRAHSKGMRIVLNPSPFDSRLKSVDMNKIFLFILNEVEGRQMTGLTEPSAVTDRLLELYPHSHIVLTLGTEGALYRDTEQCCFQPSFPVRAVDTTAAGDTFTGYFIAGLTEGMNISDILLMSAKASSIAVTRKGAVPAIPFRAEVDRALCEPTDNQ